MSQREIAKELLQAFAYNEANLLVAQSDRAELDRVSTLIRKFSRIPIDARTKATQGMLEYWRHVRGYLKWRIAHVTHPGKAAPTVQGVEDNGSP